MNCYWCKAPDPPLADPAALKNYARVGMVMRRCAVCGYWQNHVGDDETVMPDDILKEA